MMQGCCKLNAEGLVPLELPRTANSPIPGLILYIDEGHTKLEMLLADGQAVDLLKLHRVAEDWYRSDNADFFPVSIAERLIEVLRGRNVAGDEDEHAGQNPEPPTTVW